MKPCEFFMEIIEFHDHKFMEVWGHSDKSEVPTLESVISGSSDNELTTVPLWIVNMMVCV